MLPFTEKPDKVSEGFARKIAQAKAGLGKKAFDSSTVGIVDDHSAMTKWAIDHYFEYCV